MWEVYLFIVSVMLFIPSTFTIIHAMKIINQGAEVQPLKLSMMYGVFTLSVSYIIVCIIKIIMGVLQ